MCLSSDATGQRLAQDQGFAEMLGIRGTPTFVTPSGVHFGAGQLAEAFSSKKGCRGGLMIESSFDRVKAGSAIFPVLLLVAYASSTGLDPSTLQAQATANVRDSAGVRIVETLRPAWPRGKEWLLASQPALTIGDIEGEDHEVLSLVVGAVRLSDGSIVIGDGSARRIRVYNQAGKHLASFGGPGAGPGEFEVMGLIGRLRGDSIGVWDLYRKRVTIFSKTGQPRTGPPATVSGVIVPGIGWLENGSLIVTSSLTPAEAMSAQPGEARHQQHFIRVRPDGRTETVLVLRGQEKMVTRSGRNFAAEPVLFGRNSYLATSANAYVAGESDAFELRRRSWDGRLLTIIRKPGPARKVTAAELSIAQAEAEKARQRSLKFTAAASRRASATTLLRPSNAGAELPHRSTHPFFDALLIDATGHIWVREPPVGSAPRAWLVFDPSGAWLGAISVPVSLNLTDIGRDYVLGVHRDELGIESVRLYRLDRRD
jgi:hypothetical protein